MTEQKSEISSDQLSRRKFLKLGGASAIKLAATGITVGSAVHLASEVIPIIDDESNIIRFPDAPHIAIHPMFGDHVLSPSEIPEGSDYIWAGEIQPKDVQLAQEYVAEMNEKHLPVSSFPFARSAQETTLEQLADSFAGIGTTYDKRNQHILALMQALDRGQIIIASDQYSGFIEAETDWMKNTIVLRLSEIAAVAHGVISGIDNKLVDQQKNKKKLLSRRTVIKTGLTGIITAATAAITSKTILEGTPARTKSNQPGTELKLLAEAITDSASEVVSGREARLVGDIVVHQRSLKMLRNTENVAAVLDSNRSIYKENNPDTVVPLNFFAGNGHTDISVYNHETPEQQNQRIGMYAQQMIDCYADILSQPQNERHNHDSDTDVLARFSYLSEEGFSGPTVFGKRMFVRESFSFPDSSQKSPSSILLDTLEKSISTSSEEKKMVYARLLQKYTDDFLMLNTYHSSGFIPEFSNQQDLIDNVQPFSFIQGKSMQELYDLFVNPGDNWAGVPYGYASQCGFPRVVFVEIDTDRQNGEFVPMTVFKWYDRDTKSEQTVEKSGILPH